MELVDEKVKQRENYRQKYYQDIKKLVSDRVEIVRSRCLEMTCNNLIKEETLMDELERNRNNVVGD